MNTYQQNVQSGKSYQNGAGQGSSGADHALSTNYYLQKVGQHARATSDGALNHHLQQNQGKDLSEQNMDRQYQQNDRKVAQAKDHSGAVSQQQQQANERKYSLQLSLQDPAAMRGYSHHAQQNQNLNLTQLDYGSSQYNYAAHSFGSSTTKNEQHKHQQGIDFGGGASGNSHGQTQELFLRSMPKKLDGAGRHQSAPRSGRGEEAGAAGNAQAVARDHHDAHQTKQQEYSKHQQINSSGSGSLRGHVPSNSGEAGSGASSAAPPQQPGHARKQSHHALGSQQHYQKGDNSRQQYQGHHQVAQSQHLHQRADWIDKDGRGVVYQHANGMEEGRSAEIELKKGSSKGQSGTAGLLAGSTKRGGTASGSQQMKMAGSEAAMAGDGSGGVDMTKGQSEGMQTKQIARVNGNTFKNYNGKKIISIQNSYQKAEFQKNQHNTSSNSGIQSQKSGSAANHARKRSEKDPLKQQAPLPTTSYQKVHLRADKNADHHGQPAANNQEEAEMQQTQQQNDNGGSTAAGAQSLVCQVPQNQAASLQQMQRMLLLQQQQQAAAQMYGDQDWLIGPQSKKDIGRKTLVLDLDETLVHSQFKPVEGADIVLPVEIEGQIWEIYILVRPGVSEFLHRMAKHYELVVFTASLSKYAEPLVAQLDPDGLCQYKLFREHCTQFNNAFVKDLTRLGRPMTDVIIVDNSPIAYLWQPENAIPCTSWYDDMSDTELDRIATILEKLAYEDDVRRVIRKIIKNNQIEDRAEQIYLKSHKRDHSQRPTADNRRVVDHGEATGIQIVVGQPGMRPTGASAKQGDSQQQQLAGTQQQSQREKAEQRTSGGGGHHQRYESADNKQKYQGLVNEKMRRKNEVADQFSMNDAANYEQVLKMMHESGQVARQKNHPGTANEGSNRKHGRRIQDPIVQVNKDRSTAQGKLDVKMAATRGSASNAVHIYGHHGQQTDHQRIAQYQDRDGNFAQKRSLDVHGSTQISSRAPHSRHGGGAPAPLMADKKMQEMYQQQHLQLNYHPQTTKGTSSQTQQFSFDNQGQKMRIRDRQGSQHISAVNSQTGSHQTQVQSTPASKRAASVKNQNNAQILREQQQILAAQQAQLNKAQQQAQNRSRVYSAGNGAPQPNQAPTKGKMGASGSRGGTHPQTANTSTMGPPIRSSINGHPPTQAGANAGNHHRKKSQAVDGSGGHHGAGQSAAQKLQKSHSQNRQSSIQRPQGDVGGHSGAPRAQSSGNRPGIAGPNGTRGSKEASGYSQHAQRAQQIHNYFSDNVPPQPQGAHAFVSKNGQIQFDKNAEYVAQRGARGSQGPSGNNSQKNFKSNLKDNSKLMNDGGARVGNDIGVKIGLQTAHINALHHGVTSGQSVNSTKAAKKQGMDGSFGQQYPSSNSGSHQLAAQYSHRGEAMGFLNKLTQQNMHSSQGQAERREGDSGQQPSNRALQAMYLAGGIGAHAPHGVQVSLNSPKYGQALNFMGHTSSNNPSSPIGGSTGDSYIFQSDSSNSQFNRTGPIILNNKSSSFADAHFYHQLGVGAPISTKNSNISHAGKAIHSGKDQLLKAAGHGRSTRGTTSSHNPYHTQGISAHNQLVSTSMNLDSQPQPQRTLQGADGQTGGYKLKLSKKQKSTTIEPQNPVLAQNPPKTAPSSGYSAIQLNRQMDYSSKQGHAAKYLQQNRTSQQNQLHLDK